MPAVVAIGISTGASAGTIANAETNLKFNREDTLAGTTPIPKPAATGTAFSFHKNLHLNVTTADVTSISNRRIRAGSAPPTGVRQHFLGTATFAQSALAAADAGTDDATPTGYTVLSTTDQVYDAAGATASAGKNGNYARVAAGISSLFALGAGNNHTVPSLIFTYDEA